MEIQEIAFVAGIVLGFFLVLTVGIVWWKHQKVGMGGATLCIAGIALVGLSIWSSIRIEITEEGILAEFQRLEKIVTEVVAANQTIATEVQKVAAANAASRQKILALATLIEKEPGRIDPAEVRKLRQELVMVPEFDPSKLQKATRDLEQLRKRQVNRPTPP